MKGHSSSSASAAPSVDLPAPRSPTSAMRFLRARLFLAELAHQAEDDLLALELGDLLDEAADEPLLDGTVLAAPSSSVSDVPSARATLRSSSTEALLSPASSCAR